MAAQTKDIEKEAREAIQDGRVSVVLSNDGATITDNTGHNAKVVEWLKKQMK